MPAVASPGPADHAAPAEAPALACDGLVVRYGPLTAVDGLTFTAHAGEILALLGRNGAGKTSTVESLEGYRAPSAGTVRVLGRDPRSQHRSVMARIGVMLQGGGVYPMLGPAQALDLFASYYDQPEDPGHLLGLVGLAAVARTPWRHLSGGEQQRLSLALALVGRPDVAFLDEPTAGVDPQGRVAIRDVIAALRDRGCCVLLCTHEMGEAERLADRVVILHQGRAAAAGTLAELSADPKITFGAPPGLDVGALAGAIGAPVAETSPGHYEIAAQSSPTLTSSLASWLADHEADLFELRAGRSLEDTYLAIVGQAALDEPDLPGPGPKERRRNRRRP